MLHENTLIIFQRFFKRSKGVSLTMIFLFFFLESRISNFYLIFILKFDLFVGIIHQSTLARNSFALSIPTRSFEKLRSSGKVERFESGGARAHCTRGHASRQRLAYICPRGRVRHTPVDPVCRFVQVSQRLLDVVLNFNRAKEGKERTARLTRLAHAYTRHFKTAWHRSIRRCFFASLRKTPRRFYPNLLQSCITR